MIIDDNPRRSGKTTRMVMWAREDSRRVILTFSYHRAIQIQREFPDMAGRVFDFYDFQHGRQNGLRNHECEIGIDDLDMVLATMLGFPVRRASFSVVENDTRRSPWPDYYRKFDMGPLKMATYPLPPDFGKFAPPFEGEKKGFKKPKKKK